MANVILRCTRECRLTNDQGLEEHYEDEAGQDFYEVTEERAKVLLETGNFRPAPPDSPFHTSFVGATSGTPVVDTAHPPRFGGAPDLVGEGGNSPDTGE